MLFGSSASAVGVIYNTTVVPELNADWSELADEQYKDMIAIPDPEKSGACKDFLAGFVTGTADGEAVMQSWADNGLTVSGANKAALEAVTTGEKGILIAGVDYNAYSSMAKGEPLNIYYPASGTVVNPRPAMILKTAPNMDNAKAFQRVKEVRSRSISFCFVGVDDSVRPADCTVFTVICGEFATSRRADAGIGPYRVLREFTAAHRADRGVRPYASLGNST